jgi:hypothetical protein
MNYKLIFIKSVQHNQAETTRFTYFNLSRRTIYQRQRDTQLFNLIFIRKRLLFINSKYISEFDLNS